MVEIRGEAGAIPIYVPVEDNGEEPPPAEPALVTAFDIGPQRLTVASAQGLRAQGFTKAIIGMWYANLALTRSNIEIAQGEGFDVETYAYLHLGGDVPGRMRQSIDVGLPYGIARCYQDWEDDGNGESGIPNRAIYPPSRVEQLIFACDDACQGYPSGKYSGLWWWDPATGKSQVWADDIWWSADYDGNPDIETFISFGGITRLQAKQYRGTTNIAGIGVDVSTFRNPVGS
jgi:hypothetical protein